ncbi:hypothetical protein L1887_32768 [Cichorium endivia]|nr:hypothetical protein L1887_32768 [Cichorium endivia]
MLLLMDLRCFPWTSYPSFSGLQTSLLPIRILVKKNDPPAPTPLQTTLNPKKQRLDQEEQKSGEFQGSIPVEPADAKPLSALSIPSIPQIAAKLEQSAKRIRVSSNAVCSTSFGIRYRSSNNRCNGRNNITILNTARLTDIEPDLNEDPVDR